MKKRVKFILCILIIFFSTNIFSQNKIIDSLTLELKRHSQKDTVRVLLLKNLALKYDKEDAQKMLELADEVCVLSDSLVFINGKASGLFLKGKAYMAMNNLDKSIEFLEQAQTIFKKIDSKKDVAKCILSLGDVFRNKNNTKKAIAYYKKALKIYEEINNIEGIYSSYKSLFDISAYHLNNYKGAMMYAEKSLKLSEKLNDKERIASSYKDIAIVCLYQGNFPLGLEYNNKSLELYKELGDEIGTASIYNNLGILYKTLKYFDKALKFNVNALEIYKKVGNHLQVSSVIYNIGLIYEEQKKYEKAFENFEEALSLLKKTNVIYVPGCLNSLGRVSIDKNEYSKALKYFKSALKIINELPSPLVTEKGSAYYGMARVYYQKKEYSKAITSVLKYQKLVEGIGDLQYKTDAYELLSNIYVKTHDYKKAYINYKKYNEFYDSVVNQENNKEIAKIEYVYAYKEHLKKTKEVEEGLSNEIIIVNESLQKSQKYILWAVIGILLVSILFGFYVFQQKLKSSRTENEHILMEHKLLRSQMTPHFVFNSLAILQGVILNKEYDKSIQFLSKFSKLLRLTLENSRCKAVSLESELQVIKNYISVQMIGSGAPDSYNIKVSNAIDKEELYIPPMIIQPFVENAIEHGFSQKESDRHITIYLHFEKDNLVCIIKDNGIGINSYKKQFTKKQSLATVITKERLKVYAKEFNNEAHVSIKDREVFNEKGTLVTIILPYNMQSSL